jgi:transposase
MATRYRVTLTLEERCYLEELTKRGKLAAQKFAHARALLLCDEGEHARHGADRWKTQDVATAVGVSSRTVEHIKQRFVEDGLSAALDRKKRDVLPRKFDGAFEARLVALACSPPPPGRARWTVSLLADKAVELAVAPDGVADMTVWRTLKKTNFTLT